jgi:hypothetical protein
VENIKKKAHRPHIHAICELFAGGDEGDRTPYLLNAIQTPAPYTPRHYAILQKFVTQL